MKTSSRNVRALTRTELLVAVVVFGVLGLIGYSLFAPAVSGGRGLVRGEMTQTLNNARQLHLATQMLTLDGVHAGRGFSWTMRYVKGEPTQPATLAEYFDALTQNNYLTKADLRKLLSAPGVHPSMEDLSIANRLPFRIFQFDASAPEDQPFVVSANWQDRALTRDDPYGRKGFVMFKKDGSGGIYKRVQDSKSTNIFPANRADGPRYSYETLK